VIGLVLGPTLCPTLGPTLLPGSHLALDITQRRDHRRPSEQLPTRLHDPRVEVLHDPTYGLRSGLTVEARVELGVLFA
jgi:hypothetical protein